MQLVGLSVVIPCYKSEFFLNKNVSEIYLALQAMRGSQIASFEIILVVDGSPDNTISVAQELADSHPEIHLLHLTRNFGQHAAIFAGIQAAKLTWVLTLDDDGQHPADAISTLLEAITPDTDVVYGVSKVEEHTLVRNFFSRQAKYFTFKILNVENAKHLSAFRVFRKSLIDNVDLDHLTNGVVDVVLTWNTTRFATVEIEMKKRPSGQSNYNITALIKFAIQMITGYSTRPLRLVTLLGLGTFVVSGFGAIVVLIEWALGNITVPGYTTLVFLILIMGSLQLFALGIIGEYLGRIHEKSMGKPLFTIRDSK